MNFALNWYDMVVVDKGSLVSPESFEVVAATLNRLNCCPVVVIAGDKKQQQPQDCGGQDHNHQIHPQRPYLCC